MNIAEIFHITRPLFVLDLETTGVSPEEDRIVEFAFVQYRPVPALDTCAVKEYSTLVNPRIHIPEEATETHHIKDEDVAGEPTWDQLAPNIAGGFRDCDFAGKNVRFDLKLLAAEMQRAGVEWDYGDAFIVDADRLEHLGEPRDLTSLYKRRTGKDLEGAHGALTDCRGVAETIVAQLQLFTKLPRDLKSLHHELWPGWIDDDGKFKFNKAGEPCVAFGKHRGKPMRQVERGYFKWMSKGSFTPLTKLIAERASRGEFPKP